MIDSGQNFIKKHILANGKEAGPKIMLSSLQKFGIRYGLAFMLKRGQKITTDNLRNSIQKRTKVLETTLDIGQAYITNNG